MLDQRHRLVLPQQTKGHHMAVVCIGLLPGWDLCPTYMALAWLLIGQITCRES